MRRRPFTFTLSFLTALLLGAALPKPLNRVKTAGLRLKNQLPVKPRTTV